MQILSKCLVELRSPFNGRKTLLGRAAGVAWGLVTMLLQSLDSSWINLTLECFSCDTPSLSVR